MLIPCLLLKADTFCFLILFLNIFGVEHIMQNGYRIQDRLERFFFIIFFFSPKSCSNNFARPCPLHQVIDVFSEFRIKQIMSTSNDKDSGNL